MSDILEMLAREWIIGYSVFACVCVSIHIWYSVRLLISCRKQGYDVGASCMIPIWNLVISLKKKAFVKRANTVIIDEEIII